MVAASSSGASVVGDNAGGNLQNVGPAASGFVLGRLVHGSTCKSASHPGKSTSGL